MMAENVDSQLGALAKITVNRVLLQVAGSHDNEAVAHLSDKWAPQVKDILFRIYQDYSDSREKLPYH